MKIIQLPAMGSQLDSRSIYVDKQKSECPFTVMRLEECLLLCVLLGHQFHRVMFPSASRDQCALSGRNARLFHGSLCDCIMAEPTKKVLLRTDDRSSQYRPSGRHLATLLCCLSCPIKFLFLHFSVSC
jgi:hypothetical protein